MKSYKLLIIILVVFLKTGNVLSNTNIFDVNNIQIEKKGKMANEVLANQAIKKGFKMRCRCRSRVANKFNPQFLQAW